MEQEFGRNTCVLQEDEKIGSVKIADDVVAMIAALAAMEVEVLQRKVKVDLAITMEYGFNIPATCQKVQTKVKSTVENMTGLEVTDVNIRIAGINITKEK